MKSSGKYKLLYTQSAAKDISKLDSVAKKKIKKKLEQYIQDPFHYGKKLSSSKIGSYRWRIGDLRIVFDVDAQNIIILRVGHRREIYK